MGNYFLSLIYSFWCLTLSWVNISKNTLADVGSDESYTTMQTIMRLSVCFLFHRHSCIQFLCSPSDVNLEWLLVFGWVFSWMQSPSTFPSLLICSWPCVKDHPPSCFPRQLKMQSSWGSMESFMVRVMTRFWVESLAMLFSLSTLSPCASTHSIGGFFFFCLIVMNT